MIGDLRGAAQPIGSRRSLARKAAAAYSEPTSLIGECVAVWWPLRRARYEADVVDFDDMTAKHIMVYREDQMRLAERLLQDDPDGPKKDDPVVSWVVNGGIRGRPKKVEQHLHVVDGASPLPASAAKPKGTGSSAAHRAQNSARAEQLENMEKVRPWDKPAPARRTRAGPAAPPKRRPAGRCNACEGCRITADCGQCAGCALPDGKKVCERRFCAAEPMKRAAYVARQNRHEEALADYTAALQVVGANKPMLLRNRAFCYGKLGRHAEALADCEASIEEDPENPQEWVRKVNALQGLLPGAAARGRQAGRRLQSLL